MTPSMPRTRGNLLAILDLLDVENNPAWKRRDVTGDGKPETFCNQAVEAACSKLGCPLPPGCLANTQLDWLESDSGAAAGWVQINRNLAAHFAELGFPVIGGLKALGHGHVVMVVPAVGGTGLHTWQAGRRNHANASIERSWPAADILNVRFYVHS